MLRESLEGILVRYTGVTFHLWATRAVDVHTCEQTACGVGTYPCCSLLVDVVVAMGTWCTASCHDYTTRKRLGFQELRASLIGQSFFFFLVVSLCRLLDFTTYWQVFSLEKPLAGVYLFCNFFAEEYQ